MASPAEHSEPDRLFLSTFFRYFLCTVSLFLRLSLPVFQFSAFCILWIGCLQNKQTNLGFRTCALPAGTGLLRYYHGKSSLPWAALCHTALVFPSLRFGKCSCKTHVRAEGWRRSDVHPLLLLCLGTDCQTFLSLGQMPYSHIPVHFSGI